MDQEFCKKLFKCECSSVLFEQIDTEIFENNKVRIWKVNMFVENLHTNIKLLRCLTCGRLHIPSTSLTGKNPMDIEVQVYKIVREEVEKHNNRIDNLDEKLLGYIFNNNQLLKVYEDIKEKNITIDNLFTKVKGLEDRMGIAEDCIKIKNAISNMGSLINTNTDGPILNEPKRKKKNE